MERAQRLGLVGAGTIGGGVISLLDEKREYLKEKSGYDFKVVFISTRSRGTLVDPDGLDLATIHRALEEEDSLMSVPGVDASRPPLADLLSTTPVDCVFDMTPTNYETGQPSLSVLETALSSGAHAVTCSKGGVGLALHELKGIAAKNGCQLRFESAVMSGTPLFNLARGPLAGSNITSIIGILNGTTNYILTRMEDGLDYAAALAEAQERGYAETDPTGDVEGWDPAVKVVIMAAEFFGEKVRISDVDREGITGITRERIAAAKAADRRIKLIAGIERTQFGIRCFVKPTELATSHPLASVLGSTNSVSITTDTLGEVTVIGPGAGARQTAFGMIQDAMHLAGIEI